MNTLKARMIQLHKTEAEWLLSDIIPNKGELIIYDPDELVPASRLKLGDGIHKASELAFISDNRLDDAITWIDDIGFIDSGEI